MVDRVNSSGGTTEVELLGHYEVYVVSPQLRDELGVALMDSGSMISLVRESSLKRFESGNDQMKVQGTSREQGPGSTSKNKRAN
jgi:hypothetical protein